MKTEPEEMGNKETMHTRTSFVLVRIDALYGCGGSFVFQVLSVHMDLAMFCWIGRVPFVGFRGLRAMRVYTIFALKNFLSE